MGYWRLVVTGLQLAAILVAVSLVIGSIAGSPILLSYVTSESMSPTISPGDGFIAIPSAIAGEVEVGDVVTFNAERLHGGGLTTHRIVGKTGEGFLTRGDGNPSTDQAGPEPPVKNAQVLAKALQLNGHVVVIPHLGTLILGVQHSLETVQGRVGAIIGMDGRQTIAFLLLAVSLLYYGWDLWRERTTRDRDTTHARNAGFDSRSVVLALTVILVSAATTAMVVPSGPTEYGFVSSEHDTPGTRVIGVGETEVTGYHVENPGVLPVVLFLETEGDGMGLYSSEVAMAPGGSQNISVTLSAPPQTGYYRRYVIEHRYLALLPTGTLRALYLFHPWAPILVIDALIGIPFYTLCIILIGTGRIRTHSRSRSLQFGTRLRRLVRDLY